jgi:hypothetical protein
MDGLYRVFGVMFKVYSQGLFLDSVSPAPLFSSWNHLIQAGCQIIQAERGFYYQLLLAKKFDVIKLGRLVNQVATPNRDTLHAIRFLPHPEPLSAEKAGKESRPPSPMLLVARGRCIL